MPKTLYLVRHAKSDWHTGEADFDRPLNRRGRRDAPKWAAALKNAAHYPILSSAVPPNGQWKHSHCSI